MLAWRNFFLTMLRLARERETLRVVADQVGSPTWVRPVAQSAVEAIDWAGACPALDPGLYHLAAQGQTSWHGFAEAILETVADPARLARRVVPITTPEFPTPAKRPAYSVLDSQRLASCLERRGARGPGHWLAALDECASEVPSSST